MIPCMSDADKIGIDALENDIGRYGMIPILFIGTSPVIEIFFIGKSPAGARADK